MRPIEGYWLDGERLKICEHDLRRSLLQSYCFPSLARLPGSRWTEKAALLIINFNVPRRLGIMNRCCFFCRPQARPFQQRPEIHDPRTKRYFASRHPLAGVPDAMSLTKDLMRLGAEGLRTSLSDQSLSSEDVPIPIHF